MLFCPAPSLSISLESTPYSERLSKESQQITLALLSACVCAVIYSFLIMIHLQVRTLRNEDVKPSAARCGSLLAVPKEPGRMLLHQTAGATCASWNNRSEKRSPIQISGDCTSRSTVEYVFRREKAYGIERGSIESLCGH